VDRDHRPQPGDRRLRRESTRETRHAQALLLHQGDEQEEVGPVRDDQLRMIFTCCHPRCRRSRRPRSTLGACSVGSSDEIARAYLVPEATVSSGSSGEEEDPRRRHPLPGAHAANSPIGLTSVLTVLYLVFNEGYTSTSGELLRTDLCLEAVRLARALAELMPTSRR